MAETSAGHVDVEVAVLEVVEHIDPEAARIGWHVGSGVRRHGVRGFERRNFSPACWPHAGPRSDKEQRANHVEERGARCMVVPPPYCPDLAKSIARTAAIKRVRIGQHLVVIGLPTHLALVVDRPCLGAVRRAASRLHRVYPTAESRGLLGGGLPPPGSFAPRATPRLAASPAHSTVTPSSISFGSSITLPDDLGTRHGGRRLRLAGATRTTPSAHGVDQYATAADALAHQVLADGTSRDGFVGCVPRGWGATRLPSRFRRSSAGKVFRRLLTDDEVAQYAALHASALAVVADFHV